MYSDSKKRFSTIEALKKFTPATLAEFFRRFPDYLASRGVRIPTTIGEDDLDYDQLVPLCMEPGPDTPTAFQTALFFVNAMGTERRRQELEAEAKYRKVAVKTPPDCTDHDYALQVWLQHPDLLEQAFARAAMLEKRRFAYYVVPEDEIPNFKLPKEAERKAAEKDINLWFAGKDCGPGSKLIVYPGDPETWFLIRHGDKPRRAPCVDKDGRGFSFFFRPEKYDVVIFNHRYGELKINANDAYHESYRFKFGDLLFGKAYIFAKRNLFTLDPLRTNAASSIAWGAVPGIKSIRLTMVKYELPGAHGITFTKKSKDLFADALRDSPVIPAKALFVREAHFSVKFDDDSPPRSVWIKEGNVACYSSDSDSSALELWMRDRGFIRKSAEGKHAAAA